MPLVAELNGERIISWEVDKNEYKTQKSLFEGIKCPHCQQRMTLVDRPGYTLHWRHLTECASTIERGGESIEHLRAKAMIYKMLLKEQLECSAKIYLEYRLPSCGKHGRVADVACLYPSGFLQIWEVQLSPITIDSLEERTNDYANIGADVIWIFGPKSLNFETERWSYDIYGQVYALSIEKGGSPSTQVLCQTPES